MSEERYYTPESSEFHIGFEYEVFWPYKNDWDPEKITEKHCLNTAFNYLDKERVRAKYLDKSDIESLGFDYNEKLEQFISKKTYIKLDAGSDEKLIIEKEGGNLYEIYYSSNRGEVSTIFYGTIKNKVELVRVLKQIGVL